LDNRNTALVVEELHKYFGSEEVLKGISLEASEGDVIAMVGASGSGKSTFLRCINLLEIPTSGKIFVRGELIRKTGPLWSHCSGRSKTGRTYSYSAGYGFSAVQSLVSHDGFGKCNRSACACPQNGQN